MTRSNRTTGTGHAPRTRTGARLFPGARLFAAACTCLALTAPPGAAAVSGDIDPTLPQAGSAPTEPTTAESTGHERADPADGDTADRAPGPDTADRARTPPSRDVFVPSEEISEDFTVSFPVDI